MNLNRVLLIGGLVIGSCTALKAKELRVGPRQTYGQIAVALAAAKPGDRIVVEPGTYREHDLFINVPLELVGMPGSVLDVAHQGFGLRVRASGVHIEGLSIHAVKTGSIHDYSAIEARNVEDLTIVNTVLEQTFFGIHLFGVHHFLIQNNDISGGSDPAKGNGIHIQYSRHGLIKGNKTTHCRDGIYLEFTDSSRVESNRSARNSRYGLHYMFSNYDAYEGNTFYQNSAGVAVMYSSHVRMEHNLFADNWGIASYGLLLKDISDGLVRDNQFTRNTTGLFVEGSNRVKIEFNTFENSGWALRLLANCTGNELRQNVFRTNSFDLATNGTPRGTTVLRNYWDRYEGYDLDRDRIGDVPHFPITLYSALMERQPGLIVLYRSFITNLLDWVDRILPSLTPDELVDEEPLMQPEPYAA